MNTNRFESGWPPDGAHVVARFQCGAHITTRMGREFKGFLRDCDGEEIAGRYLGYRLMSAGECEEFTAAVEAPL